MLGLPDTPTAQRATLITVIAVLAVCAIWIAYLLRPDGPPRPTNNPVLTADVSEAQKLTAELRKDPRFINLEIARTGEGKWQCGGEVKHSTDVQPAQDKAKELKPGMEWEFNIVPMSP